jgi:outer membrane protein assembly factor BamB
VKKVGLVLLVVVVAAAAAYQIGGVRVAFDGSGSWPRFVSTVPDFDALEADRASQRERMPEAAEKGEHRTGAGAAAATTPSPQSPDEPAGKIPSPPEPRARPAREQWTDFRGRDRDGRYAGRIRTTWPAAGLPLLWKQPIGLGYASFVAADGRAFTIEQRRDREVLAAYDIDTGRELWTQAWPGEFREILGGDGPRATPTYYQGRVYALGALGELRCLDAATGAVAWRRNILADSGASNLPWGMAAAPLVVDDKVIVLPGGHGGKSIAAYSWRDGSPVWASLDDQAAYSSPMLATLAGVRQLLVVTAVRVVGVTVDDGRLLWEYPWATSQGINAAQPVLVGGDRVFVLSSYGQGAALFEVSRSGDGFTARELWRNNRMKNRFTSSLLHDGYLYGLDESILACLDAATGELKWKGGRYGYGQTLLVGDHIVVLTEDGDLVLVRATPERHEEIGRFPAIEGKTWNHPIIVDGRLLVRNIREMAAFDVRP